MCRYYNRGHCKKKSQCSYIHPRNICKFFLKDGKCEIRDCCSRHPKNCRYNKKGCFRGLDCDYLHYEFQNENESQSVQNVEHFVEESDSEEHVDDVMTNEMSYQEINDDIIEEIVNTKPKEPCANCGSEDIKNLCDKCEKYFCQKCEFTLSDMGVQVVGCLVL